MKDSMLLTVPERWGPQWEAPGSVKRQSGLEEMWARAFIMCVFFVFVFLWEGMGCEGRQI